MPIIKRPPSRASSKSSAVSSRRASSDVHYSSKATVPPRHRHSGSSRVALWLVRLMITVLAVGALIVSYVLVVMAPQLPSLEALTHYQPKVPLRVYTADHVLIGEFGEERRSLVRIGDIPEVMKKAVLAIEDTRFYDHGGVDFIGIVRAGVADLLHRGARQGASTITMQVARNFFLSSEKTYTRKLYEMLLAYKIEKALTKDQILELYMNQIYLGQRAYGFAAAARVYFGKDLQDVTLAEAAMLAGLPKAPSAFNPVVNPKRAKIRQEYILKRMLRVDYITPQQYEQALREEVHPRAAGNQYSVHAEYVAEMVRQMMYAEYKDETYTRGLTVITTLNAAAQEAAYQALRKGIMDYEQRHGYRGPEGFVSLSKDHERRDEAIDDALAEHPDRGDLQAAVVLSAAPTKLQIQFANGTTAQVQGSGLNFVSGALSARARAAIRIQAGSIVRVMRVGAAGWRVTHLPQVEGALVALAPQNGAVRSLVGGFDFSLSKFNHVTQAWRQPGSTFKPFIYSAALDKGLGPATIIDDAPLYFPPSVPGAAAWEPKDDDQPDGPMSMRMGLQRSKNLVSIRILAAIGTKYAQDYVTQRFGFDLAKTPPYLPMALGAGLATPLQMAGGYAVLANGGYKVNPYLIAEVVDAHGQTLQKAAPLAAGETAPRMIEARNAYIMTSLLHSAATVGTGAGTQVLRRSDLQGKTGTTNDAKDGWFAGYQQSLVTIVWMGFDQPRSLGSREFGAQLALPIWVNYMRAALSGVPEQQMAMPDGLTMIDNELYYADRTPGNGFVMRADFDEKVNPISANDALGTAGTEGLTPPPVTPAEKQQIIDLFENRSP